MFRLNRLMLKGFKSIREMDIELGALNVLIGGNGAGKSNLLSFFRMLRAIRGERLQLFVGKEGGANAILHYGRKNTRFIEATVSFGEDARRATYSIALAAAAPDDLVFEAEALTREQADGRAEAQLDLGGGHRESRLREGIDEANKTNDAVQWGTTSWRFAYYHFHDTSPEAAIKQSGSIQDNRRLADDGGNHAAFLYLLKQAHSAHYESIRDAVRLAAPFFDDFVLEPDALNPNMIHLEWRERGSDMPFFAHQLSDGTLRFMTLATALLQPELPDRPQTIVIDEPELGLHPYAITLLAAMMRSAATSVQIIAATQSVNLLDELAEPEDVLVVERSETASNFRRLDPEALQQWLDEYTLGELWEKNVLGGRPSP
jgi:predicted ATPase